MVWNWPVLANNQDDLARFVLDHCKNPCLDQIYHDARKELALLTKVPFCGFDYGWEHVHCQVRALYNVLLRREPSLAYALEPQERFAGLLRQFIRLPSEVLDEQIGDCMDLVVLLACLLIKVGLNPLIAIVGPANSNQPSHAILGYWLDDQTFENVTVRWPEVKSKLNSIAFLEATGLLAPFKEPFPHA